MYKPMTRSWPGKLFPGFICLLLLQACSHPLEIVGQGDIDSESGTRNCSLEEFNAESTHCTKNFVAEDYSETYTAVPRSGWEFACWGNYQRFCDRSAATPNECRFSIDALAVRQFWGETVPPLRAHFSPEPDSLPPPPAPEPFTVETIPLPATVVRAFAPIYTPDGSKLVLAVKYDDGATHAATMNEDGSDFACHTCGLIDTLPKGNQNGIGFLADNNSLYLRNHVLECSPSILDCQNPELVPVDAITTPFPQLFETTNVISPDGIHIGVTKITTEMLAMGVMGALHRVSDGLGDRYEVINQKVIAGDRVFRDPDENGNLTWLLNGSGEVKRFMDRGASFTAIGIGGGGNFDVMKTDLSTGKVSRFTKHFSMDESVYESPDGEWAIVQTLRTSDRMDVFGLVPRPTFVSLGVAQGIGHYRNQQVGVDGSDLERGSDRRRFYGLTLLDKYGDRARSAEDGYVGQDLTVAPDNLTEYNQHGSVGWHPGSTGIVFWEQRNPALVEEGEIQGRLRKLTFTSRTPTVPVAPFTPDAHWAQPLDENLVAPELAMEGSVLGAASGHAEISFAENPDETGGMALNGFIDVTYVDYSDDGLHVLNGTETVAYSLVNGANWNADVTVSGCSEGSFSAQNVLVFPREMGSGIIRAELGARVIEQDLSLGLPTGVPGELQ